MVMKTWQRDGTNMQKCRGLICLLAPMIMAIKLSAESSSAPEQGKSSQASLQRISTSEQGITPSELMGYTVENQMGEKLGLVKNMVIDTRSGWLDFVIVSSGGLIGLGSKLRAVPASALSPATAIYRTLAIDITVDRWKSAPTFSNGQLASLSNPAHVRRIYQYYGRPWPPGEDPALPATGRESGTTRSPELASDLIEKNVVNARDQDVGRVVDLLVNLKKPQITFAILKPAFLITSTDQSAKNPLFAVPVYAFNSSKKHRKLVLEATAGEFRQAPPLNADGWRTAAPGPGSPRIFRYQTNDSGSVRGIVLVQLSLNRDINN